VAIAEAAAGRVAHVHLKDVDAGLAERVRDGRVGFAAAVRDGLFRPLGTGAVDVAGLIRALERQGYDGWYVLEQDTALDAEPLPGRGPMIDVGRSLAFVRGLPRMIDSK
jgi:inosose dehydratase